MKKLIISGSILLLSFSAFSQSVDATSQKMIDAFVRNNTAVNTEAVDPAAVSKVFTGKFYRIEVGFVEAGSGFSNCGSFNYVNINGSEVKMTEAIHTDLDCPNLVSMIRKDFLLKDENAAKLFEAALNAIYPVEEDEAKDMKHLKKGTQWIFVRSKFFDDYTVFVVTTAANGAITKIDGLLGYTLN